VVAKVISLESRRKPTEPTNNGDYIRSNGIRKRVGQSLGNLLHLGRAIVVPEKPIIFRSMPENELTTRPISTKEFAVFVPDTFQDYVVECGIPEDAALDLVACNVQTYGYVVAALHKKGSRLSPRNLGFDSECWISKYRSPYLALAYRLAGAVAIEATGLDTSTIRRQGRLEQSPQIAGLINPIEQHEVCVFQTVLQ